MLRQEKSVGKAFIDSLDDGRNVWIGGEKVKNIAEHPAFAGPLQTIEEMFDHLNDLNKRDIVGYPSPKTNKYVHKAFLIPKSHDDLASRKEAFSYWAEATFGAMSRLTETGRSYLTGWYSSRHSFDPYDVRFSSKIKKLYEQARDENRLVISVVADPQVNRGLVQSEQKDEDLMFHVVKETEEGVIVRGAKVMATAAPYAHDIIVLSNAHAADGKRAYSNFMVIPANTPGVHMICRDSFSTASPSLPISQMYDEMDATVVFDDVLVPWERVLLYDNPEAVTHALIHKRKNSLANHQSVIRLIAKMEFLAGVGFSIVEAIGTNEFLNVQEQLGEIISQVETLKGLLIAAEATARPDEEGTLWPNDAYLRLAIDLGARHYPRAIEILQNIGGGGFLQVPSAHLEQHPEVQNFISKYYQGAQIGASDKVRLFKLAWDLIGSQLGSRHELYERFFSGDPYRNRAARYKEYDKEPLIEYVQQFLKKAEKRG